MYEGTNTKGKNLSSLCFKILEKFCEVIFKFLEDAYVEFFICFLLNSFWVALWIMFFIYFQGMNLKGLFNVLSTKPNYNKVMVMTLTVRDQLVSCHVFVVYSNYWLVFCNWPTIIWYQILFFLIIDDSLHSINASWWRSFWCFPSRLSWSVLSLVKKKYSMDVNEFIL